MVSAPSRLRLRLSPTFLLAILLAFAATTNADLANPPQVAADDNVVRAMTLDSFPTGDSTTAPASPASAATSVSPHGDVTNAPLIAGVGVPPLIVPDTADAPFMQKSDLPDGTVFICVGAALGFLGMSVLAWRGLVAWSLHRSVRRAATAKYASEQKPYRGGRSTPARYSSLHHSANVSLEHLASANTGFNGAGESTDGKKSSKPPKRSSAGAPRNSSLFFSPTAGAGTTGNNRTSTYMPAGFYASGTSMPAAGAAIAQLGGPPAAGYGRVDSYPSSPPTTPSHVRTDSYDKPRSHGRGASRGRDVQDGGASLSVPRQRSEQRKSQRSSQQHRAPSAVLDELFEHHTGMKERD